LKDSTGILSHVSVVISVAVIFRTEAAVVVEEAHSRAGVVEDREAEAVGEGVEDDKYISNLEFIPYDIICNYD
jgi:hypothetical protein